MPGWVVSYFRTGRKRYTLNRCVLQTNFVFVFYNKVFFHKLIDGCQTMLSLTFYAFIQSPCQTLGEICVLKNT